MKAFKQLVNNIKPSKSGYLLILTTFLFTLFTQLIIEVTHRGSFTSFFDWSSESTFSFIITFLFLFFLIGSFLFLPNFLFIPIIILELIFWFIVAFGSHIKFQLRGEYFTPFDLFVLNEGADISSLINGMFGWKEITEIVVMAVILFIFVYFFKRHKKKVSFINRMLFSIISIICFSLILTHPSLFSARSFNKEVETVESYQKFGFIGAFLTLEEKAQKAEPENYNKREIKRIVTNLDKVEQKDVVDPNFKPNVIVVLAEAVWDPLLLKNITFKEDPLPYFRSLMETNTSGVMVSHVFGGGTFNTELEVLTGLSTRFTPEETYYNQINRPLDSLAYQFKKQGYQATAVHNFKNWYYSRNRTYKQIGFEKFVPMEFYNNPKYIGPFIDDRELMKKALNELKQTKGPDFLDVVTVATHGPYNDERFENMPTMTTDLTDLNWYIMNLYANLLKEFDDSMRMLIEGVKELDEPTMVVVYGDHLPLLGEDYSVYREAGYFNGDINNYEEYKKMYQTPLLVWDNYSDPTKREDLRMTPNFLGSYILAHAKKEMSPIFQLNRDLYLNGTTVIPKKPFYKQEGVNEKNLVDYQLLQYDALKGSQYSYQDLDIKPDADYTLGEGKIAINSIKVKEEGAGSFVLDIYGKNLVSGATVFIDGKKKNIQFIDGKHITAKVQKDPLKDRQSHEVIVKVLDDDGKTVIVESNSKKITLK